MEYALGSGQPEAAGQEVRDAIAGYNRDDCLSTWRLRDWVEGVRAKAIDDGHDIPRPVPEEDEPSEAVDDKAQRVADACAAPAGVPEVRESATTNSRRRSSPSPDHIAAIWPSGEYPAARTARRRL
jgi:hypothetical protein